jgi:hypothetical protein
MEKFLDQFGLTPMQRVNFEQFVFGMADRMVGGYCGGMWETREVNGVHMLLIPEDETKPVQLKAFKYGEDMFAVDLETDHATASATFSVMVTTWYWNINVNRLSDDAQEKFSRVYEAIGNAVHKKSNGFDTRSYSRYVD